MERSSEQGTGRFGRTEGTTGASGGGAERVAVVDIWTFNIQQSASDIDLTGFSVEARDGRIGKVDEVSNEAGGSFLIVDTGPLIFGKKVMLPAGVVDRVNTDDECIFVNQTKDEIKGAPEYDDSVARDPEYRDQLGGYYTRPGV